MYKGNMGDFAERVNLYLQKHYDSKLVFGKIPSNLEDGEYFVAFFAPGQEGAVGYRVFDSANFEQQIYDYINEELSNVQGEYDGFPEQANSISGEDISEFDSED